MDPRRDFTASTEIRKRYGILSSPRSGGTLLGRMLYDTGQAGDPLEYFNLRLLQIGREQSKNTSLALFDFLRLMESRRTSPNGVFGIKIQYDHILRAFRTETPNEKMVKFLERHDCLFWVRRRNKIRQAISHAIAVHTNAWSSEEGKTDEPILIPLLDCITSFQAISHQDLGWEQLFQLNEIEVSTIWYEDLVAEYEATCRLVLTSLRLDTSVPQVPSPSIRRQSGTINEQLYAQMVDYLGAR